MMTPEETVRVKALLGLPSIAATVCMKEQANVLGFSRFAFVTRSMRDDCSFYPQQY